MPSDSGTIVDPQDAAESVGLVYVTDADPGITRRRTGKGFSFRDPEGRTIRDKAVLARARALAIPPAWTDVWICPDPDGHIQATGRDAKGRKQYRYHDAFRGRQDKKKYLGTVEFGAALPKLRRKVEADLKKRKLDKESVVAAVVRLIDTNFIRVGNEQYAKSNKSFGSPTLRNRHLRKEKGKLMMRF